MADNLHYCFGCGVKLSDDQIDTIERLKKSSAHCFARGACDVCWDKKIEGGKRDLRLNKYTKKNRENKK